MLLALYFLKASAPRGMKSSASIYRKMCIGLILLYIEKFEMMTLKVQETEGTLRT